MPVYVDPLIHYGMKLYGKLVRSCHMYADDIFELHAMAYKIGLKRKWFQDDSVPHYDITRSKRELAVKEGATEMDRNEAGTFVKAVKKLRNKEPPSMLRPGVDVTRPIEFGTPRSIATMVPGPMIADGAYGTGSTIDIRDSVLQSLADEALSKAMVSPEDTELVNAANLLLKLAGREERMPAPVKLVYPDEDPLNALRRQFTQTQRMKEAQQKMGLNHVLGPVLGSVFGNMGSGAIGGRIEGIEKAGKMFVKSPSKTAEQPGERSKRMRGQKQRDEAIDFATGVNRRVEARINAKKK